MANEIELLTQASGILERVSTTHEALALIAQADLAKHYARKVGLGTSSINYAQQIKLQAECKLADIVDAGQEAGTIATQDKGRPVSVRDSDTSCDRPAPLDQLGIERRRLAEARKVRDNYTPDAIAEIVEEATAQGREVTRAEFVRNTAHVGHNSGENEWYTPPAYIEAARLVMGSIDLDPATSDIAQKTVGAAEWFTAETNGLDKPWVGNVWLNPPYAQPLIGQFVDRVTAHHTGSWCVLVNNATDTKWGQQLMASAHAVCFTAGRIRFHDRNGNPTGAPLQGQMIAYRGDNPAGFAAHFAHFGTTLRHV